MVSEAASYPALSDAAAARAVDGALAEARVMGVPVTVTVVDDGGNLKSMRRMDGALVSVQTAQNKAYAAAAIGMPVDEFFEAIKEDAAAVASFAARPGLALIAGGIPLRAAGVRDRRAGRRGSHDSSGRPQDRRGRRPPGLAQPPRRTGHRIGHESSTYTPSAALRCRPLTSHLMSPAAGQDPRRATASTELTPLGADERHHHDERLCISCPAWRAARRQPPASHDQLAVLAACQLPLPRACWLRHHRRLRRARPQQPAHRRPL